MLAVTLWTEQWRIDLYKTLKAMVTTQMQRLEKVYVLDDDSLKQKLSIFHGQLYSHGLYNFAATLQILCWGKFKEFSRPYNGIQGLFKTVRTLNNSEIKRIVEFFTTSKNKPTNHLFGLFWKLQVKGNLLVCSQIWTVASLTYNNKNLSAIFFISN